ncbi:Dabb family protein [Sphingobacterium wenxiniae]|uniref:Tat (Twin-arginine translocation) pathway signal sequence n=1 Tax=Sphingobacterium wenxiniae TaxID=683125 RepID=A0A1I6T1B3_9SPHI|nr:Dabb family protein [Sphingobacterium wenxiniae]SFS82858.1 Tat (twin-arginine translocation) pathway signal sequence [Sphingobacterium wenxiniae]
MERRNFLKSAAIAGLSGVTLASCAEKKAPEHQETDSSTLQSGLIFHSVYFWLKEDITAEEEQDFLNFFEELRAVPGVRTLHFGKPAATTPRPVVDNSFQYCLLVTFDNLEAINTYEIHPLHITAAEKYSKYWTKVEVRDTVIT